jgi:predicted amidohydrolase
MRKYKIALLQMDYDFLKKEENIKKAIIYIEIAAKNGAKLICLPESFNVGYLGTNIQLMIELSEGMEGHTLSKMKELAKNLKVYLIVPIIYKEAESIVKNTAFLIDDTGEILGKYNKTHLVGDEQKYFKRGNEYPVFKTPIGNIGILICYDICFPETSRILALKEAELIIVPAAWRASYYFKEWWDLNLTCRALDNLVYVAAVNRIGSSGNEIFAGKSQIINPIGETLASCSVEEEKILYGEVNLDTIKKERDFNTILLDRHPEDYTVLIEK